MRRTPANDVSQRSRYRPTPSRRCWARGASKRRHGSPGRPLGQRAGTKGRVLPSNSRLASLGHGRGPEPWLGALYGRCEHEPGRVVTSNTHRECNHTPPYGTLFCSSHCWGCSRGACTSRGRPFSPEGDPDIVALRSSHCSPMSCSAHSTTRSSTTCFPGCLATGYGGRALSSRRSAPRWVSRTTRRRSSAPMPSSCGSCTAWALRCGPRSGPRPVASWLEGPGPTSRLQLSRPSQPKGRSRGSAVWRAGVLTSAAGRFTTGRGQPAATRGGRVGRPGQQAEG